MPSTIHRVKKAPACFMTAILLVAPQIAQAQNCQAIEQLSGKQGDPFEQLALTVDKKQGVSILIMDMPIISEPAQDCELYGPWQARVNLEEKAELVCTWDFISFDDADRLYGQVFDTMNGCLQENLAVDESREKGKTLWRQKQMIFESDHSAGETIISFDLIAWPPDRAEADTLWTPEHYWVSLEVEFIPAN